MSRSCSLGSGAGGGGEKRMMARSFRDFSKPPRCKGDHVSLGRTLVPHSFTSARTDPTRQTKMCACVWKRVFPQILTMGAAAKIAAVLWQAVTGKAPRFLIPSSSWSSSSVGRSPKDGPSNGPRPDHPRPCSCVLLESNLCASVKFASFCLSPF